MELLDYIWNNPAIRIISLSLLGLAVLIIIILFINHLKKINNGQYSKFFWIESGTKEEANQQKSTNKIVGKNINTGTNHGKIGDN